MHQQKLANLITFRVSVNCCVKGCDTKLTTEVEVEDRNEIPKILLIKHSTEFDEEGHYYCSLHKHRNHNFLERRGIKYDIQSSPKS